MKVFCSSFLPVTRTLSALTTITKSPVSTCGVKTDFSFPRNRFAAFTATRPSTSSFASMSHHLRGTSDAFAENVFITGGKRHGNYGRWPWVSTVQSFPKPRVPVRLRCNRILEAADQTDDADHRITA